jgi:hypothetical protein
MSDLTARLKDIYPRDSGYADIGREAAARIQKYEAAMREIVDGFRPDGTYAGRPIYEIAADCTQSDRGTQP